MGVAPACMSSGSRARTTTGKTGCTARTVCVRSATIPCSEIEECPRWTTCICANGRTTVAIIDGETLCVGDKVRFCFDLGGEPRGSVGTIVGIDYEQGRPYEV